MHGKTSDSRNPCKYQHRSQISRSRQFANEAMPAVHKDASPPRIPTSPKRLQRIVLPALSHERCETTASVPSENARPESEKPPPHTSQPLRDDHQRLRPNARRTGWSVRDLRPVAQRKRHRANRLEPEKTQGHSVHRSRPRDGKSPGAALRALQHIDRNAQGQSGHSPRSRRLHRTASRLALQLPLICRASGAHA